MASCRREWPCSCCPWRACCLSWGLSRSTQWSEKCTETHSCTWGQQWSWQTRGRRVITSGSCSTEQQLRTAAGVPSACQAPSGSNALLAEFLLCLLLPQLLLTFKSLIFKPLPKPSFGWTLIKYGFVMCLDVKAEESKHSSTELKLKLTVKFWQ